MTSSLLHSKSFLAVHPVVSSSLPHSLSLPTTNRLLPLHAWKQLSQRSLMTCVAKPSGHFFVLSYMTPLQHPITDYSPSNTPASTKALCWFFPFLTDSFQSPLPLRAHRRLASLSIESLPRKSHLVPYPLPPFISKLRTPYFSFQPQYFPRTSALVYLRAMWHLYVWKTF